MGADTATSLIVQLAAMLVAAKLGGRAARALRQPEVVGEMLAGIVLGPTLLGTVFPAAYEGIFASSIAANALRESVIKIGMLFFLFTVGLEIELKQLREHRLTALLIGSIGTVVPLLAGIAVVYLLPWVWRLDPSISVSAFAVLLGASFANSANPVLARILSDLGESTKNIGAILLAATVVDDLAAWSLLALVSVQPLAGEAADGAGFFHANYLGMAAVAVLLTAMIVRHRSGHQPTAAPRTARRPPPATAGKLGVNSGQAPHELRRSGKLWLLLVPGVTGLLLLASAMLAEGIGLHAYLGAFLAGVGLSPVLKSQPDDRRVVVGLVQSYIVPVYFVSLGVATNFIRDFDLTRVAVVVFLAFATKLAAVYYASRLAGLPHPISMAAAWGMNARGATGIILASYGRDLGIIDAPTYVALVTMCILTSIVAGPLMQRHAKKTQERGTQERGHSTFLRKKGDILLF